MSMDLYNVRCTQCGELLQEDRLFPLQSLLINYDVQGIRKGAWKKLLDGLNICAYYGEAFLPDVKPLLGAQEVTIPDIMPIRTKTNVFVAADEKEASSKKLSLISLNIASIVAQFCLTTGFTKIYNLLKLRQMEQTLEERQKALPQEAQRVLTGGIIELSKLPSVRMSRGGSQEAVEETVLGWLDTILQCAMAEKQQGGSHFASEPMFAAWQYKEENKRNMPFALLVLGQSKKNYSCTEPCCCHCVKPIPYKMGAYQQKVVGILGTQSTGKSTFLSALTDAIAVGEVTTQIQKNGSLLDSGITFEAVSDTNWLRAHEPNRGIVWRYQHGLRADKTDPMEHMALSFVAAGGDKKESVMYTFADIPGEAFSIIATNSDERMAIKEAQNLLFSCDALFLVVSRMQLLDSASVTSTSTALDGNDRVNLGTLVKNPLEIINCCQEFLPNHPLPTAVIMTSADLLNDGALRIPLQTAYEVRNIQPLVWSEQEQRLVYNAEAMHNSISAVRTYLNKQFGTFMEQLMNILAKRGSGNGDAPIRLSAFAVSNGTQEARTGVDVPLDVPPELVGKVREQKMEELYGKVRQARFGVSSVLLWLLANDGVLALGHSNSPYNQYSPKVAELINKIMQKELFQ